MNRIQTRALMEGAIFAAITVVIGIIRFYVPIVSLISIVWSVPAILIAFRHGFKVSIISVLVSFVLVAVMTNPFEGLGFFFGFGIPGIIMGYLLKKKFTPGKTIFITGLVLAVCSIFSIYFGALAIGIDIIKSYDKLFIDMKNAYRTAADTMASLYGAAGVSREELMKTTESFVQAIDLMKLVLPGLLLIAGFVTSFINFKLTKTVLKRINHVIDDVTPFSLWRLSAKWVIVVMSLLLFVLVEINMIRLPQLYAFSMNIFTGITVLFTILGLSVGKFFLDKFSIPNAVKGIILFFAMLLLGNMTMLLGVLDMLFNFRKLKEQPTGKV